MIPVAKETTAARSTSMAYSASVQLSQGVQARIEQGHNKALHPKERSQGCKTSAKAPRVLFFQARHTYTKHPFSLGMVVSIHCGGYPFSASSAKFQRLLKLHFEA